MSAERIKPEGVERRDQNGVERLEPDGVQRREREELEAREIPRPGNPSESDEAPDPSEDASASPMSDGVAPATAAAADASEAPAEVEEPAPPKETRTDRRRKRAEEKAARKAAEEAEKAEKAARKAAEEAVAAAAEDAPAIAGDEPPPEPNAEAEEESKRPRLRWKKKEMPAGLFIKCESCGATIYRKELVGKGMVCPDCGFHFTLGGPERIEMVLDEGTWNELFAEIETLDRLDFTDKISYAEKIARTAERLGQKEALLLGTGAIEGRPIVLAVLDFKFMGGSMGEVVGEKIALAAELAIERRLPLLIFTSSGGARMHEGMLSLMQMAKTCAALQSLREAGGFSICVMTNPTTGGVTASFASVTDIVLAEPGALIGFAGPRVIATTLKQELPKGFQRAEFLLEKGQVDRIVERKELRGLLARLIDFAVRD